jgi:hypothetical protein
MVLDLLCNFNSDKTENYEDSRQLITKAYSLTGAAKLESIK